MRKGMHVGKVPIKLWMPWNMREDTIPKALLFMWKGKCSLSIMREKGKG